jgi:Protein of unknown function (DUF2817)
MTDKTEASFADAYRSARKAFIAAASRAHGDSIARVHPTALGPDGKPLFIDSVALGSREAQKALLVIASGDGQHAAIGSLILTSLLDNQVIPLARMRLVLIHALNPFGFAWGHETNENGLKLDDPRAGQSWSLAMLRAIATEDLARVQKLRILDVGQGRRSSVTKAADYGPARVLKAFRPEIDLIAARLRLQPPRASALAKSVVTRALATL